MMHPIAIFGLTIASLGAVGVALAGYMEIKHNEPKWMLIAKLSAGLFGFGGLLVGVLSWIV